MSARLRVHRIEKLGDLHDDLSSLPDDELAPGPVEHGRLAGRSAAEQGGEDFRLKSGFASGRLGGKNRAYCMRLVMLCQLKS